VLPVLNKNSSVKDITEFDKDFVLNKSCSASTAVSPMVEDEFPKVQDLEIEAVLRKNKDHKPHRELSSKYALDYDNLNDCVEALLKKAKGDNGNNRDIKRRQRKNKD
jgi:hypothetical protein